MANPLAAVALTLGAGLALMVALAMLRLCWAPDPELTRKLFHCGIGMIALTFPWLFDSLWLVVATVVAAAALLFGIRKHRMLREWLGAVLDGVGRRSFGDWCYLAAIPLLFGAAQGDALLYSIPILVLAIGDAGAALVGKRFGRWHFGPVSSRKSVEGSATFFVLALTCSALPLVFFADWSAYKITATVAAMAAITTAVEAVARRGFDNLLIPVAGFIVLSVV